MSLNPLRCLLPLALGLLCMDCHAQQYRYATNFTLSKQNFCDSIDIEFEQEQVYVPVEIQGRRYRFLLDTGSSQGVVYDDTPIDGCQLLGNIVSHDAIGRRDTVRVVGLPPFWLGDIRISGYVASVLHRPVAGRRFDGIIGFDLFNKGIAGKMDVRQRKLILTDNKQLARQLPRHHAGSAQAGYELKYKLRLWVPHVPVSPFADCHEQALFDTGSRQLFALNYSSFCRFERRRPATVLPQVEGRSVGQLAIGNFGTERLDTVVFLGLERLGWGGFGFCDVHHITTQGGSHIGASLLNYGTLTVNPFRRRLVFTPYGEADTAQVSNRQFQIAFVPRDGRASVGLLWEQSEAYRRGFRQGDVILQIDGRDVPSFSTFVRWGFLPGRDYRFLVRDVRGFVKEVVSPR